MQPLTAPAVAYHPAFTADRLQTTDLLRRKVRDYEDIFRELVVVMDLPEDTALVELPALVEACLQAVTAQQHAS